MIKVWVWFKGRTGHQAFTFDDSQIFDCWLKINDRVILDWRYAKF